jgi:hypothetical protein
MSAATLFATATMSATSAATMHHHCSQRYCYCCQCRCWHVRLVSRPLLLCNRDDAASEHSISSTLLTNTMHYMTVYCETVVLCNRCFLTVKPHAHSSDASCTTANELLLLTYCMQSVVSKALCYTKPAVINSGSS